MHLFFYPIAESYWLVGAIALVMLVLLALVGPRGDRMSVGRRVGLAALRAAVFVLVILAMLRPTFVYTEMKKEKATLVLLIDQTRSMTVHDGLNGKSRWDALRGTLDDAAGAMRDMPREFEIKAYTFDAETHAVEVSGGKVALPVSPEGTQTAVGAALDDIPRQEGGKRLLGIVLLTDGRQQALPPRDAAPQTVAGKLRHQGDPVFPIVFGQSRGLGAAQDIAVKDMQVSEQVFVKNELTISGQIRIDGYVNREIPVRALVESAAGKMEVVAQENVKATADGQLIPVHFTYVPEEPGEYKVTLEAVAQPGEVVTTNNQLSTFVQVLKGGLSVLYIEGEVRSEQRFLRRALDASRDIKVDTVRLDPRRPQTRPGNLAELFQPGKYDAYILGDVHASAFLESELKQLAETVNRGAGLIMLGGMHSFGPGGYYNTPLANVLPVVTDRLDRQLLDEPPREDQHWPGPLHMRPTPQAIATRHFAVMLAADPQENAALWASLPPLDGANRFRKLTSDAVPLIDADGDENKPLLVTHLFGAGRVIAFAGDTTWHWPMHGFEAAHNRFWRQIVLWLAQKDQTAEGSVWVKIETRRVAPGERVQFRAGAQTPHFEPIKDAEFRVEIVTPPKNDRVPGLLIRQDEQMTGTFRDTSTPGDYAIEVTASQQGKPLGSARARFFVMPQDLELDNAAADPDSMESVAKATGGRVVAPEQLPDLIREIAQQTQNLEVKQETKKTFWDKWPFFLMLVTLLSVEWYLRKRFGLV